MGYFQPDVLVSTDWVEEHKKDKDVRIVEVDVDTKAYEEGHIEGSIAWNWQTQLCDPVVRGHENVRIMNGGRKKWITETKPLTQDVPTFPKSKYQANEPDWNIRAYLSDVQTAVGDPKWALVDVRSPDEFTGKILAPPGLPETCQRGGHIPGAQSIPWGKNCNEDGTFKSADELASLYETAGVTRDKSVIAYCRIGERSSLSWFVLQHLLGYPKVVNYDGSWTEWGNLVNAPVAR
jgi:thiosulfate/3-mercaptopyruvate sulfurtransferase